MDTGKLLIVTGVVILVIGILVSIGFRGLPGDIVIQKKNTTFVFPIVTSILLSLLLTLVFYFARR